MAPDEAVAPDEPEGTSTDFMSVTLDAASALDGAAVTTLAGPGLTLGTRNSIRCKVLLHQRIHLPIVDLIHKLPQFYP